MAASRRNDPIRNVKKPVHRRPAKKLARRPTAAVPRKRAIAAHARPTKRAAVPPLQIRAGMTLAVVEVSRTQEHAKDGVYHLLHAGIPARAIRTGAMHVGSAAENLAIVVEKKHLVRAQRTI